MWSLCVRSRWTLHELLIILWTNREGFTHTHTHTNALLRSIQAAGEERKSKRRIASPKPKFQLARHRTLSSVVRLSLISTQAIGHFRPTCEHLCFFFNLPKNVSEKTRSQNRWIFSSALGTFFHVRLFKYSPHHYDAGWNRSVVVACTDADTWLWRAEELSVFIMVADAAARWPLSSASYCVSLRYWDSYLQNIDSHTHVSSFFLKCYQWFECLRGELLRRCLSDPFIRCLACTLVNVSAL